MRGRPLRSVLIYAVLALSNVSAVRAAIMTYATRSDWEAALGTFTTETFNTVPLQTVPLSGGIITTPSGLSLIISPNHGEIGIISFDGGRAFEGDVHGPGAGDPQFNILDFPQPVTAFAADFAEIDEGGLNNVLILGTSFALPYGTTFFGVTSDVPFSQVEIRTTGTDIEFYVMNNASFATVADVPEPSTLTLFGLGTVLLLGFGWRHRQRPRPQKAVAIA